MHSTLVLPLLVLVFQAFAQDIVIQIKQNGEGGGFGGGDGQWELSFADEDSIKTGSWKKTGPGVRFQKEDIVLKTLELSLVNCKRLCYQSPRCVSFNYQHVTRLCEFLNTAPIPSDTPNLSRNSTWSHYTFSIPHQELNANVLCPEGAVLVPYDYPVFEKFDPLIDRYVCTDEAWVLSQIAMGLTDCRMVLLYQTDSPGQDIAGYTGVVAPYHEALKQCQAYSCNAMACYFALDRCWLKHANHVELGQAAQHRKPVNYWFINCSIPKGSQNCAG